MDERVKPIKFVPGPGKYHMERSFTTPALTKLTPKIDLAVKKNTYIEQIIHDDEKYKRPGVGKYNLTMSVEDEQTLRKSKRRLSFGEKISSLDNFKRLSNEVPGVGQYNLRTKLKRFNKDTKDQDYYKNKHKS